jgi:hypothetical protein
VDIQLSNRQTSQTNYYIFGGTSGKNTNNNYTNKNKNKYKIIKFYKQIINRLIITDIYQRLSLFFSYPFITQKNKIKREIL